ncbi:MAG: hypothetical protein VX498_00905 [Myxococcota bacterium]|nr:hypothetical protein [Myxococcota bacterium]
MTTPPTSRYRLYRVLVTLPAALVLAASLSGFTGNVGSETEFYVGVGLGQVETSFDSDQYGEIGGVWRHKFRNFPYHDTAAWIQVGGSWTTYPTGGNFGNQIVTLQYMGGVRKNFGEFGGGFVLSGDTTGAGPLLILPSFHMLLGSEEKVQFGFGVLDEAPFFAIANALHMEGIFRIPTKKNWRPRLRAGMRLNLYAPGERFPMELFGGLELKIGRHFLVMLDGSIGDGGSVSTGGIEPIRGGVPSFSAALRIGATAGPGVKSDRKPAPAD